MSKSQTIFENSPLANPIQGEYSLKIIRNKRKISPNAAADIDKPSRGIYINTKQQH